MPLRDVPIRKKLVVIILLTTGVALLVTCASFFAYEFLTFRRTTRQNLATLGEVIAANSTAALAFDNPDDARETLAALKAEKHITAAALYTATGKIFARYPANLPDAELPGRPEPSGYRMTRGQLVSFQPVVYDERVLGTLFLQSDWGALRERLRLYAGIVVIVAGASLLIAFILSHRLQRQVSRPILDLADTAQAISERRDFSVRAPKHGADEIGRLTDAFNAMLAQIQQRDQALRESESRLRAVLNSAVSAVVVTDDRGQIVDANARAERVFGWKREQLLGLPFAALFADRDREELPRLMAAATRQAGDRPDVLAPVELAAQRQDHSEFPSEVAINALRAGAVTNFCGFITDITERKRAAAEIRTLNEQLEKRVAQRTLQLENANKELEAFSYSVSHDLRAPLRHIDGFAGMLTAHAGGQLDEKGQRYLTVITEAARRMGRLIDDLLSFSRHGRAELRVTPVRLGDLVEEVQRQLQTEIANRRIVWKVGPLPEVHGDRAMLHQVFANLLGNAVKYTRGRAEAMIEIGAEKSGAGEWVVFVRDNGAGFNPKYTDRLFNVFQRLHSESEFEGTGVGLANVRRIVQRHGGRTWAEGQVDVGATIYFALPDHAPALQNAT